MTLKPCPMCGSRAEVVHASHIRCVNTYNCDCETRLGETAWNRRASLPEEKPPAQSVPEGMWYFTFFCEDFDSVQRVRVSANAPRQFACGVTGVAKAHSSPLDAQFKEKP